MIKTLAKSEIKEIQDKLQKSYGIELLSKKDIVQLDTEKKFIFVNKELWFFTFDDRLVPTLKLLMKKNFLRKIVVDMGAVKFVTSGADIMRPGVVAADEGINSEDFVVVVDEKYMKPLSVGMALFNSKEIEAYKTGRVVKNIHYVGDEIWSS